MGDRALLARAASRFRLAMPRGRLRGAAGERLGGGTGSSLELQDLREYVPGDDPRHLDWRAYARTDRPQVRLYREEVAPFVDIVIDLSASMAVTEAKAEATADLAEALVTWSERAGGRPRLLEAGGDALAGVRLPDPSGADRPTLLPRVPLRRRGIRVLVSDLLRREDPGPDLGRLGYQAAELYVIQLLDPWERNPAAEGAVELVDAEREAHLLVDLDERALAVYAARLARLTRLAERATRAAGGVFVTVTAEPPETMFRGDLLERGVIEPVV